MKHWRARAIVNFSSDCRTSSSALGKLAATMMLLYLVTVWLLVDYPYGLCLFLLGALWLIRRGNSPIVSVPGRGTLQLRKHSTDVLNRCMLDSEG
jgi:hypothetical protein